MDDESDHGTERSTTASPTFPTINDVHQALHPLQATADRIGRQVEDFAETLDRLSSKRQKTSHLDCRRVLPLVDTYKKIARDTTDHLQSMHAPERRQQLSKQMKLKLRKSGMKSMPGSTPSEDGVNHDMITTVDDLKRWQQEEQTWDILSRMLQVEYPIPESGRSGKEGDATLSRPSKNNDIHRYSSEKDVWNSFLASDDQAWERHTVVEWLKRCADQSGQDIEQMAEALESDADRGSGLWAHSWLYTKEAIKGQKRLRSWPRALEADDPGLANSLMNAERTKALVTQLDPDAISRQGRDLEKQDHFHERAIWLSCWEMLRRGKSWDYVREWCKERGEGWRATAMRGDPRGSSNETSSPVNWQSRYLWRKTCALAARDGGVDEYENAVYGVLSGHLPSVQKICRSWDDYLFAHYNTYLLHSFDRHIKHNLADRVPHALVDKHSAFNFSIFGGQRTQSANQIVEKMKHLEETRKEAFEPLKMLQGSLVAKTFDEFVFKHGVRLTRAANANGKSKILRPMPVHLLEGSTTAPIGMEDHDYLRLITHILFAFQDLGHGFGEGDRRFAMESIIVAYVDYLSKAGKQQLLPLYASRLSPQRSVTCLGRQLPSIQDRGERQTMLRLMKAAGLDVPAILSMQLQMIIADTPSKVGSSWKYPELRILEQSSIDDSAVRAIQSRFIGDNCTDDQLDLVHGFEWYMLLDGHWGQTMRVGVVVYKFLLRKSLGISFGYTSNEDFTIGSHGLAAARLLSKTVTFSNISLGKTHSILGQTLDLSKDHESSDEDGRLGTSTRNAKSRHARHQRRRRSSSSRCVNNEREVLLNQASTFRDFENLLVALDAMETWKELADEAKQYGLAPKANHCTSADIF